MRTKLWLPFFGLAFLVSCKDSTGPGKEKALFGTLSTVDGCGRTSSVAIIRFADSAVDCQTSEVNEDLRFTRDGHADSLDVGGGTLYKWISHDCGPVFCHVDDTLEARFTDTTSSEITGTYKIIMEGGTTRTGTFRLRRCGKSRCAMRRPPGSGPFPGRLEYHPAAGSRTTGLPV